LASSADRKFGVGWVAFGAAVLAASWRMDRLENLHINPWSAPGLMPGILGLLMMLFGAALALRRPGGEGTQDGGLSRRRTGLALALCFLFAGGLLGHGLPFWLTAAAFMFLAIVAFRVMDAEPRLPLWRVCLSSAAVSLVAALVIGFLFESVFLVRLP
jgi:hypothetical protein